MRCTATRDLHFDSREEETARCTLAAGHDGMHRSLALDSDDNPIHIKWANRCHVEGCGLGSEHRGMHASHWTETL